MRLPFGVPELLNVGLITALALGTLAPAVSAEPVRVTVDPTQKHQTMEGFGASGAWWHTWTKDYPPTLQEEMLDLLHSRTDGIGLSIFRYNLPIGGGEEIVLDDRRTNSVETSPGNFDLAGDADALRYVEGARDRGVEHFVFFACSPPARMTINGFTSGGPEGGPNLKPGSEGEFAAYLINLSTLIRDTYGLKDVTISPINEPQWRWGKDDDWRSQEGCFYTPQQAATMVGALVRQNIGRDAGFKIEAPESGAWLGTLAYADALFADPVIGRHVDHLAVHSYWTNPQQRAKAVAELRAAFPDKLLAQTEYCQMQHGHDLSIESGIELAEVIHEDLAVADVVSWQWWLGVGAGGYKDGLLYARPGKDKIEETKRLWVLGQWSRFVRPGDVRVAAESGSGDIRVTAFSSADARQLKIIMINSGDATVDVDLEASKKQPSRMKVFVTDAEHDLAVVEVGGDTLMLPAMSVTTVLLDQ